MNRAGGMPSEDNADCSNLDTYKTEQTPWSFVYLALQVFLKIEWI